MSPSKLPSDSSPAEVPVGPDAALASKAAQSPPAASPELLKIGDFARLANTNLRTLRYYEELGLMVPASRSEGGFRYYRRTDVNRLNMIRSLQELGLHLDQIRALLAQRAAPSQRSSFFEGVRAALQTQDELLERRIGELSAQRAKLRQAALKLDECSRCVHHPAAQNNFCEPCLHDGLPLPETLSALY